MKENPQRTVIIEETGKVGDEMELTEAILSEIIKKRPANSHKGTFGRSLLIGGNQYYGGAIIMSAEACISSGSGLTTVVTAEKNHAPLHARLPEAMVIDFSDTQRILKVLEDADVILVGPGLGLEATNLQLFETILQNQRAHQWLVIDGSAITLFAENQLKLPYPEQTVFTPHQMEWQRLSGIMIREQNPEKNQQARDLLQATIVLKSHRTTVYSEQEPMMNTIGTPAMAIGGMGDTLAGMITGFLAQFDKNSDTIAAAVYLHSLIGEDLGKEQYVVLPTKISEQLPYYLKKFEH